MMGLMRGTVQTIIVSLFESNNQQELLISTHSRIEIVDFFIFSSFSLCSCSLILDYLSLCSVYTHTHRQLNQKEHRMSPFLSRTSLFFVFCLFVCVLLSHSLSLSLLMCSPQFVCCACSSRISERPISKFYLQN